MTTRTAQRARPAVGDQPRRSTRKPRADAPVQTPVLRPVASRPERRMIRTEPVKQAVAEQPAERIRKSTRHVIRTEPVNPTRHEVFTEKREEARYRAPLQFFVVLFGAVIVSVLAFGLLRGEPPEEGLEGAAEKEPMYEVLEFEQPDATSTNTGILRGD